MDLYEKINQASEYLSSNLRGRPTVGLILGSGLGVLANDIEEPQVIPYSEIPYFPVSTVEGHAGELVFGNLNGKQVLAMKGRFHYYEGYSMEEVTFPVRVMKALGIDTIIVTNAAGGVNREFNPGDLMIIEDHINFAFDNPLMGKNDERLGVRFTDMSSAYDKALIKIAEDVAKSIDMKVQKGVYTFLSGPTYETPSEVKMVEILGGDAVGMSTVPEVMVAIHGGMRALGISCISNMASGILPQPLNHEEVIETTQRVKAQFTAYIKEILLNL
ncbi:purine-nucleoside phosphorylase [Alkaliphilus peptidifermentans]|uniref:Purine nucleoside phosphorylase n=1 Tax=Alkaliphilus peptidifermentans DSM 18978 TaxID=1120976 RepID=A0A1G5KGA2_9FIRM|nr:purine-nucleoside phosphorylase [Alkaliphilus peptidifermentans]SCY98999.1 purine-nucleoside phosphorylase [Alkaliphilus peptidifermentans DSM 18978]